MIEKDVHYDGQPVVEFDLLPGLHGLGYSAKVSGNLAMFTGSGLVKGQYAKDVASSHTLSPYAYRRFLSAVLDADFFSIKTGEEITIIDSSISVISVSANDRRRTIRNTELAFVERENAQKFHGLMLAIHELTGLNEWLASTFDEARYYVVEHEDPDIKQVKQIVHKAREFTASGRYEEALVEYDGAIEIDPANTELLKAKCDLLREIKSYDRLARCYEMLWRRDRSQTHLLNDIGQALHRIERFEEAVGWYDRAISARPTDALPMFNKGLSLLEMKRFEEAITCFDYVRTDNWRAYFEKGLCLVELGRFEEAIETLRYGLALYPSYQFGLVNMARSLNGLGRYEEALRYSERALEKSPENSWFLTAKGISLSGLYRIKEALQSFEKAIEIEPMNTEAQIQKARILAGLSK